MTRRALSIVCVLLIVLAGCSAGPQNRQVTGAGRPATLSTPAADATGFTEVRASNETLETRVETTLSGDVSVQSIVEVDVTTPVREYRRDDGAVVGIVSTPAVQPIENRPTYRDPLATESISAQVERAQKTYEVSGLEAGTTVGNVTLVGTETALKRYTGTSDDEPVVVFVARARDEGDFVTVVLVVPEGVDVDVARVVSGVEH